MNDRPPMNNIVTKNNIVIAGSIVLGIFILLFFVYFPSKGKMKNLKIELNDVDSQIKQIELVVERDKNPDQVTQTLEERFASLEKKFPQREEAALGLLSDFAQKSNVNIVSTRSQPKILFMGKNGQAVVVDGKSCYKFLISLEMKSTYNDLLNYLEVLDSSLPALVDIERLRLIKDPSGTTLLNVNMDLNLYLLI